MNYRVLLQDGAIRAIEKHARYIAEEKELPLNAERWLTKLLRAVDTLAAVPSSLPSCA